MTLINKQILLMLLTAMLVTGSAWAGDAHVESLERKLQQRDMVVRELLERVEALEQRLGIQNPARNSEGGNLPGATTELEEKTPDSPGSNPGKVVVSETEAERALERSLTRDGALLLRPGVFEIEPSLRYTRQEDTSPRLFTSGSTVFAGETEDNRNSLTANLSLRFGLPWDSQLEFGFPYRWSSAESVTNVGLSSTGSIKDSGSGVGDLSVGFAKTLLREGLWRPDLVGRLTWNTGSGESTDGGVSLGGGIKRVTGSLSAIKRQDPMAFIGGLSYEYSFEEENIQPGDAISASFGSYIALSPETSLLLLLSAGYQDETSLSGRAIDGSDRVLGTFLVGGSMLVAPGALLSLSAGIGLTDDSDDLSVMLSLPMRFN